MDPNRPDRASESLNYEATAQNPASPLGLRQTARQGAAVEAASGGALQPWYGVSYLNAAKEWAGGRNLAGEESGLDTQFSREFIAYQKQTEERSAAEQNPMIQWDMFDTSLPGNEQATGVATWNDPKGRWKAGDVFYRGERKPNLYESMDAGTADQLMATMLLDGYDQAATYEAGDLSAQIEAKVTDLSKAAKEAPSAIQFDKETRQRAEDIAENPLTDVLTFLGGAAGGATVAAANPITAIIGGIAGGVGAVMNQDAIIDQVARSAEITERAMEKYDPIRGVIASAEEWSGVGMKAISPFSNLWQGSMDAVIGGGLHAIGDSEAGFYATDAFGQRKAEPWMIGGDLVATAGDSILQFASQGGRGAYMGIMGVTATSGMLTAIGTQGTFNYRTGQFDPFESASEWFGGIGSPLIDFAQLGMARAVSKAATQLSREAKALGDTASTTVNVERAGMRWTVDKTTGKVVEGGQRKWTLGALAPSENIWRVPVRWKARSIMLKDGRDVVSPDDLYQAAMMITSPASPWRGILTNGLAEGYEEAWQGFLDPMAVGDEVDGRAVFLQAGYGFMGGAGMSGGALLQRGLPGYRSAGNNRPAQAAELQARLYKAVRDGYAMDDDEWAAYRSSLGSNEKEIGKSLQKMARADTEEARQIKQIVDTITNQLVFDESKASVLGSAFVRQVQDLVESGLRNVNPNEDESLTILAFENAGAVSAYGIERTPRSNTAMMSAWQTLRVLDKRVRALEVQESDAVDDAMKAEVQQRLNYAIDLRNRFLAIYEEMKGTTSAADAKATILRMNLLLQQAYDGKMVDPNNQLLPPEQQEYWKKVGTIVFGRHPFIDSGSFAAFMPQVSIAMTLEGANASIGIHQGFLERMQADHDGDRSTTLNLAYLPDSTYDDLRRGMQQFASVENSVPELDENGDPVVDAEGNPVMVVEGSKYTSGIGLPDGENMRALVWQEELNRPSTDAEHQAVAAAMAEFEQWVLDKFADYSLTRTRNAQGYVILKRGKRNPKGPLPYDLVVEAVREWHQGFEQGDAKVMQTLRDTLTNIKGPEALGAISEEQPVLVEMQQFFSTRFLRAEQELARLRLTAPQPTPLLDQRRPDDVQNQKAISMSGAANSSQLLAAMGNNEPTRDSQLLWYNTITRILADVRDFGWTPQNIESMAREFRRQMTGDLRTELEIFLDKDPVQGRVMSWLDGLVQSIERSNNPAFAGIASHELRVILGSMEVPSVRMIEGEPVADTQNTISMVQYFLRLSLQMEEDALRHVPEDDPRLTRLSVYRSMTYDNGPHSYTPKTAMIEMMRFLPMEQVVGQGGDADYLGRNKTLDQLIRELVGMNPVMRKEALHRLKRESGAYMTEEHRGLGDPPYTFERGGDHSLLNEQGQLRVNAYTLIVDALEATVNNLPARHLRQEKAASELFRNGHKALKLFIEELRTAKLREPGGKRSFTPQELLEELIRENSELADMIVALVPEASLSGTFMVDGNQVFMAPWLMDMLLTESTDKAEVKYFTYKHLTAFNAAGATVDRDLIPEDLTREEREEYIKNSIGAVDFDRLKSRFQQTLFIAAEDPTGFLLSYMLQVMESSETLDQLLEEINKVPALLGNRAPLLGYVDDVAQFESRPEDLWTMGLTSTQMMEALTKWGSRVKQMSDSAAQEWVIAEQDDILLREMQDFIDGKSQSKDAKAALDQLQQAILNRRLRPDSVGPVARSEFLRVCWDPMVPMQDKGAAPEVAQFVESILTSFSFGVRMGWEQAIDDVSAYTWNDISTNVTLLLDGPVQIMMPDGSSLLLDMTKPETLIKMLQDRSTRAFAKAVLFDTVRDVDRNNSLQHYNMTQTNGSIQSLLFEQTNIDLLAMDKPDARQRKLVAHRGIGLIESALIKKAMSKSVEEQGKATLPITKAMGEILTAFTTRPDLDGVDKDALQDDVVESTWALLVAIASLDPEERGWVKNAAKEALNARVGSASPLADLQKLMADEDVRETVFRPLLDDMSASLLAQVKVLETESDSLEARMVAMRQAGVPLQDPKFIMLEKLLDQKQAMITRKEADADRISRGELTGVQLDVFNADAAKLMYTMQDENEPGIGPEESAKRARANAMTRLNIRNLLELGNNKEAFRGKGVPAALLDKLAEVTDMTLYRLDDPVFLTEKDWAQLSMWAATVHFTHMTEFSANPSYRPLGTAEVDRLYDRSFSYLTDVFFDDAVLDEIRSLIDPALPLATFEVVNTPDVLERLVNGLLRADRLGPWNHVIVGESLKVAELVRRGPVGLSIAAPGSLPARLRSQFGSAKITTTRPLPEHMTTLTFNPDNPDPVVMRQIENSFFSELTITNVKTGQTQDMTFTTGVLSARDGVKSSGYYILRARKWNEEVRKLKRSGFYSTGDPLEVSITFVDPDKKPFLPEYENSVFFDKAGRTEEYDPLEDVISESVFSTEGFSKVGQQRVFDATAKGGTAGFPSPRLTPLDLALLDRNPAKAGEFIRRAADLILNKQYNDMNSMLDVDQAAIIKLLKQRFVVVGKVNGVREVHWIDEVISWGGRLPFDTGTATIVELNDEIAATLLSEHGLHPAAQVAALPLMSPHQMARPGSLDSTRLEQLGITRLGEVIEWDDQNSPLRSFRGVRVSSMSDSRGEAYSRTYRKRMKMWADHASSVKDVVPELDRQMWDKLNSERLDEIMNMLGKGILLRTFENMGLRADMFDTQAAATDMLIRSKLKKFFGEDMSGRRVFKFNRRSGDLGQGILSEVHLENDFEQAGKRPPLYGDFVWIDLDQFVEGPRSERDLDEAARLVRETMEAFGKRGVRIFLNSTAVSAPVKERIAVWMQSRPMGYEPLHNSTSVYVPIIEDGSEGRTARLLRQSLTVVEPFSPQYVVGRLLSDRLFPLLGANENTILVDTEYDKSSPWRRMAQLLAPGDLTIAREGMRISLNYPTDRQMERMAEALLPLIEDDVSWEALLTRTNKDKKPDKADPRGASTYSRAEFAGGSFLVEPGILSVQAAREALINMLKSGKMPGVGDEILPGQFLPLVNIGHDNKPTVVLTRVGFKLPREAQMLEQWDTSIGDQDGIRIAMPQNELNGNQTVPPPMRITQAPHNSAHGLVFVGDFEHSRWGKWVDAALGYKGGRIKLTSLRFTGPMAANGFRPSEVGSLSSVFSKLTTDRLVDNLQDVLTVTGWDIRNLMVDAFVGKQASEADYKSKWNVLRVMLDQWSNFPHGLTEDDVYAAMTLEGLPAAFQTFNSFLESIGQDTIPDPTEEAFVDDPTMRIATLVVMSLMAPRIHVQDVVSRPGMMTVPDVDSTTFQVVPVPALLTKALQNPNTPNTMQWIFDHVVNANMERTASGKLRYWFDTNFRFHSLVEVVREKEDGSGEITEEVDIVSWFQLVKPTPATEDLNSYANSNNKPRTDESLHIGGVLGATIGATITMQRDFEDKARDVMGGERIVRFGETSALGEQGDLWHMLTRLKPRKDRPERLLPLQWKYLVDALGEIPGFTIPYDKTEWTADIARVEAEQAKLLNLLGLGQNLSNNRVEVDYLVRQFYGSPGARKDQKDFVEPVTAEDYIEAVRIMIDRVKDHRNPLQGAKVTYPHEALLRKIVDAGVWMPAMGRGKNAPLATNWNEAVYAILGQVEHSREMMDPIFRKANDGFLQTYRDSLPELGSLSVSGDFKLNARLLDPEVNMHFLSMDPGFSNMLENPVILAEMDGSIRNLMGLTRDIAVSEMATIDSSSLKKHRDRVERWADKQQMAPATKVSYKEYFEDGAEFVEQTSHTHALFGGLINLSLINRLFNPSLYASAIIEKPARTALETVTDLVLGEQVRMGGGLVSGAAEAINSRWQPMYSTEDIQTIRSLARQLATRTDFKDVMYKEIMYLVDVRKGRGKISTLLESGAAKVARAFSDPFWGLPAQSYTEMYLVAAIQHMISNGAIVDIQSFAQEMKQDPLFLVKLSTEQGNFSAHKAGMNRIANTRSMKRSAISKPLVSSINTLNKGNFAYASAGFALKIPFMFANFMANYGLFMTGLGGADQLLAMLLDGRKKPGFVSKMSAHISGEKPDMNARLDMSDVLEGVDLSRAFIRGGITQTGLFTAALFASSLGLGGEDDEMKKRRKLAEAMNTPLIFDPMEAQNNFLYADAIFVDSIWGLNTIFRDTDMPEGEQRSAFIPPWYIQQFTAPMMGTMRFLDSGDFGDITAGFAQAFSVVPLSVTSLWNNAVDTADLLWQQAEDQTTDDMSPEAQSSVMKLLINGFSIYESALIENSFVNQLRNGSDKYNRNPWILPATTTNGEIAMREGTTDMPLPAKSLESFRDPVTGEVREAYATRSGLSGEAHGYAENHFTFSLLASLVTGQLSGDSTFLRNNMVVGETKVNLKPTDKDSVEALVLGTYIANGGQATLSFDEAVRLVKKKYEDADIRWNQTAVEAEAQDILDTVSAKGLLGGMSVLSPEGQEILTTQGAKGMFHAIGKGGLQFDDQALIGVSVDMPTRMQIEDEWWEDIIQEGIDLGLNRQNAEYRAKRLMLGDTTDPSSVGLREILYSDEIPYSSTVRYNQLNTTWMIGPDGKPWMTPFERAGALQALGLPIPQRALPASTGMRKDSRGMLVDEVFGINLGAAGLERQREEPPEPPDWEEAFKKALAKTYTPQKSQKYNSFRRFGGGGYGGGGGGGYFSRMYALPRLNAYPRTDDIPFINVSNPYVRRARVNTERITADRGRLKQWQ